MKKTIFFAMSSFVISSLSLAGNESSTIQKTYQLQSVNGLKYSAAFLSSTPTHLEKMLKSTFRFGQCSGTFVSKYGHVLTALHCIESLNDLTDAVPWGRVRNPAPPYEESQGFLIPAKPFSIIDNFPAPVKDIQRQDFSADRDYRVNMRIVYKGAAVPEQFPGFLEKENRFLLNEEELAAGKNLMQDFAIVQVDMNALNRPWTCTKVNLKPAISSPKTYAVGYPNQWGRTPEVNYIPAVTEGISSLSEKNLPKGQDLISMESIFPDQSMNYTTAPTAQGMSGGGLFNESGELIGVLSAGQGRIFSKRSYQTRTDFIAKKILEKKPESFLKFAFDCP